MIEICVMSLKYNFNVFVPSTKKLFRKLEENNFVSKDKKVAAYFSPVVGEQVCINMLYMCRYWIFEGP
jgi:hypothetical protein